MKDVLKKSLILGSAAAMLAGTVACGPTVPFSPQGRGPVVGAQSRVGSFAASPRARAGKKWTLMVHLAGDNNLYSFALEDVNEMEAGLAANPAAAEAIDVIVLFDGTPKGDSKILRIKPDAMNTKIVSEVIDDKGFVIPPSKEIDSGDAATAAKFVDFATKNFPSANNAHYFWNHGSGIFRSGVGSPEFNAGTSFFDTVAGGGATGQKTRGSASKVFAADDNGTEMFLRDVNPIMAVANANLGKAVDIVGFDACLMQHIETAYQYKGQANILVASEELEPGKGWDYRGFIGPLAQNPDMTPPQLAKVQVDSFIKSYMPGGSQGRGDVTLSALDINAVANVFVPALNELSGALIEALPTEKQAIATTRTQTQGFYNRDAADLGDFVKKYAAQSRSPRVGAAINKLNAAIGQTLIAEGHYGSKVQNATGIQVYFPTATMSVNKRYDDPAFLKFAETKGWSQFLHAFTGR